MTEATRTPAAESEREIVQTRLFDAPRELVFQAWTHPVHLPNWFGPKGFRNSVQEIDIRPGGMWRFVMHGPDGTDYPNVIKFLEIVENERITFDHGAEPDEPAHFHVTVTFEDEGGQTRMTMRSLFPTAEAVAVVKKFGAVESGRETLDKLATVLDAMRHGFRLTRTFDAPQALVYKAWTEAERLAQWWGPKGYDLKVLQLDLKPGGCFHFSMTAPEDQMWAKFIYVDLAAPDRLAYVSAFSDAEGNTVRAPFSERFPMTIYYAVTFTEENGKTTLTLSGTPHNATEDERAFYLGMFASMQQGFGATFDQLDVFLAKA